MKHFIYFCNRIKNKHYRNNRTIMSIKDRFKMVMDREKLTAVAFAESIGVAQSTISHILGSRNKYPSMDIILRLHDRYSDISLDWLLTGAGNMSNESTTATTSDKFDYPLFAENRENLSGRPDEAENHKEMAIEIAQSGNKEVVKQEVIYKERPLRKITEIRIFFDDNTYETFKPETK